MATLVSNTAMATYENLLGSWADVGILVCCFLSLACRLAVYNARRRANSRALRACCESEEALREMCEPHACGHTSIAFGHTPHYDLPTMVNATCYAQFALTVDFAQVQLTEDDLSAVVGHDGEGGNARASRAATLALLERTSISGADGKAEVTGDPVLILLQLPVEQRLVTMVNWLSVVSNCLTYYLRPSQVLYTFVFNMTDFFVFVVSVAETRHRCSLLAALMRSTDLLLNDAAVTAGDDCHATFPPMTNAIITTAAGCNATKPTTAASTGASVPAPPFPSDAASSVHKGPCVAVRRTTNSARVTEAANVVRPRWARRAASACTLPLRCVVGGLVSTLTMTVDALQSCLSSSPTEEVATSTAATSTPEPSVPTAVGDDPDADAVSSSAALGATEIVEAVALGPGQTGARELLLLNAALAFALVLFHKNHIFFAVGAMAGYVASGANLFLLGSTVVNACIRCCPATRRAALRPMADTCLCDRAVALLAHWFAAACAVFYFCMLLDEGDVLWSTHVNFMRWYAATVAVGLTELFESFVTWRSTADRACSDTV